VDAALGLLDWGWGVAGGQYAFPRKLRISHIAWLLGEGREQVSWLKDLQERWVGGWGLADRAGRRGIISS